MNGEKTKSILLFSFFIILLFSLVSAVQSDKDWSAEYHRLNNRVEQNFSEPKGDPPQLGPYLHWMEIKARDRNEVRALLEEAKALSKQNPSDELLKMWVNKFSDLLNRAQASGENTVNGAVLRLMRIEDPKFLFNQLPSLLGENEDPIEDPPRITGDCTADRTTKIQVQWDFKKIKK